MIGSGISALAAAWRLSGRHRVTVYEADERPGGHCNTIEVSDAGTSVAVDTGFIVFNEPNYPNLTALLNHFGIGTVPTTMSFSVSVDGGAFEYSGAGWGGLLAQKRNLVRPRFWSMLSDTLRFFREAPALLRTPADAGLTLGEYLERGGYGHAFIYDHLLPMGAAIWSTPTSDMLAHPARPFVEFCQNHGLLSLTDRPTWRTVVGGSRAYVAPLLETCAEVLLGRRVRAIRRAADQVWVEDATGERRHYDHVVIGTHADQALAMLSDPDADEEALLGAFPYQPNLAVVHSDPTLMPRRRAAWASWNFLRQGDGRQSAVAVTYWMNRLQGLTTERPIFITLNPPRPPRADSVIREIQYEHPLFGTASAAAQPRLWSLQGRRRTWYCGAYFGFGFHEDGLQSGLAVADALDGARRPWTVADESGRIHLGATPPAKRLPTEMA